MDRQAMDRQARCLSCPRGMTPFPADFVRRPCPPPAVAGVRRHNDGYEGDRAMAAAAAAPRCGLLPRVGVGVQSRGTGSANSRRSVVRRRAVQDHLARCVGRSGAARPRSLTRPGAACRAWFEQTFGMLSTRRLDQLSTESAATERLSVLVLRVTAQDFQTDKSPGGTSNDPPTRERSHEKRSRQ